jgi:hypothetical protein
VVLFVFIATGFLAGLVIGRHRWGWAVLAAAAVGLFVFGTQNPIEGDDGLGTGLLWMLPPAFGAILGGMVHHLAGRWRRRTAGEDPPLRD